VSGVAGVGRLRARWAGVRSRASGPGPDGGVRAWSLAGAGRLRTWWSGVRGRAASEYGAEVAPRGWPEPIAEEVVVEAVLERPFPAPGGGLRAWPARLLAGPGRLRSRRVGTRSLAAPGRRVPEAVEAVEVPAEERDGREPGPGAGGG
jgi:hypothetical protein